MERKYKKWKVCLSRIHYQHEGQYSSALEQYRTWREEDLVSLGLKVRFIWLTTIPIATSACVCESWAMTHGDMKRFDAFEHWCFRRLIGVSWMERKTNKWVLDKC